MEFIDPKLKQKHSKRLQIGYGLLIILVSLATYILVATAMGFQIFQRDGQVVQNGIVYLDSKPLSTDIYINGKKENNKTDTRLALAEGDYEVILKSDGYKDWTKRILVEGGKVKFINYPRLFPVKLTTEDLKSYNGKNSGFNMQSPDRHWIVFQPQINSAEINIIDTTQTNVPQQVLTLPNEIIGATNNKVGSLDVLEWSGDNKHFLIKHTADTGIVNFSIINREDISKSINLNKIFNIKPTKVSLFDGKIDKVYLYFSEGGVLKIGDVNAKVTNEQIADQVLGYKPYGNNRIIFATTKNSTTGKVVVNAINGNKQFLIGETEYDSSGNYNLDAREFSGDWYFIIGSRLSDKVHIYKNPENFMVSTKDKTPNILTTLKVSSPTYVNVSPSGRFILASGPQSFMVYDTDLQVSYKVRLQAPVDSGTSIKWLDDFLVQYSIAGKLYLSEFDGKNVREMAEVKAPYLGSVDGSFKRLYVISDVGGVTTSRVVKLTTD
jgi:hypothetical protein